MQQPTNTGAMIAEQIDRFAEMDPAAVRAIAGEEIKYLMGHGPEVMDVGTLRYELARVAGLLAVIVEQEGPGR